MTLSKSVSSTHSGQHRRPKFTRTLYSPTSVYLINDSINNNPCRVHCRPLCPAPLTVCTDYQQSRPQPIKNRIYLSVSLGPPLFSRLTPKGNLRSDLPAACGSCAPLLPNGLFLCISAEIPLEAISL